MNSLNPSLRTYVYRNLRDKCLSLMQRQHVVGHTQAVLLTDVEFRVRASGRQKVLQKKQKNVHAFAIGMIQESGDMSEILANCSDFELNKTLEVLYNPYRFEYFYNVETLEPVRAGKRVLVTTSKIYVEK